jgi:hypothetical protein
MTASNRRPLLVFLAVAGLCIATVFAQEDGERDPFAPRAGMQTPTAGDPTGFVRTDETGRLPQLALRGYIEDGDGNAVALLEVSKGATYLVRQGDTVSISQQRGNVVLRVREISNLSLLVEVGELRQVYVVR